MCPKIKHPHLFVRSDADVGFVVGQSKTLFLEDKEYGEDQADESHDVIPAQGLVFHNQLNDNGEYGKRYGLLNHLQLPNRERSSILGAAEAISRHHKAVFEEGNHPTDEDYCHQTNAFEARLKHHLTIPSEGHKYVGTYQKSNSSDTTSEHKLYFVR